MANNVIPTPTNNDVPSADIRDHVFAGAKLDQAMTSTDLTFTDRKGVVKKTWVGLQDGLDNIIASLDTASFTFPDIDSGLAGTTEGQYFRVVGAEGDMNAFYYYRNVSGSALLVAKLASQGEVEYAIARTNKITQISSAATSALYPELITSGPIESVIIPEFGRKLAVISSATTTYNETRSYLKFITTVDGVNSTRYLPTSLLMIQDDVARSYFEPINLSDLSDGVILESNDTMIRIGFNCGKNIDTSDNYAFNVIDVSGVFSPGTAGEGINYTLRTIMGSSNVGKIQFSLPIADIVSAGYSPTSAKSIYSYLRLVGIGSYILVKTNVLNKNDDISRYVQQELAEGVASISCKSMMAGGVESNPPYAITLSLYKARDNYSHYRGDYLRLTADIMNRSTYNYNSYPAELKVSFPIGAVINDNGLILTDDIGNEYPCQFSGEMHPNKRLRSERTHHPDGSLSTGSLFYTETLAASASRNLELKAYTVPMRAMSQPKIIPIGIDTKTVTIGGYVYSFGRQQNWLLTSIKDPSAVVHSMLHSTHVAGLSSGAIVENTAVYAPSLRIITSGPVFVELEHVVFNGGQLGIPLKSLRFTTRYRLFAGGKVQIKVMVQAESEISSGILAGVHSRLTMSDGVYTFDNNSLSTWFTSAPSGKVFSVTGIRAAGDEHRDGTAYGPTRPAQDYILNPDNIATRIYMGWKYTSPSDYSFLNWKVKKDWVWVQEFWIDCECSASSVARDIISLAYNRPVGFLGQSGYPTAVKQKLISKIQDHVFGSMEWWYSFDAASSGGYPYNNPTGDRVWQYAAVSFDIMRHIRYGWSTTDAIYTTLDKYLRFVSGGATSIDQIGNQYLAGKLLLQFSSRLCIGPMEWMYKLAVKEGNTTVQNNMKGCIKSFADAIVTYYNAHGAVGLNGSGSDTGVSNSNAAALRILALGIYAGQDTSGSYLSSFEGIEALLNNTSGYMYVANVIKDGPTEILPARNWLHYQIYTMNSYACACYLLGRTPVFNMINYTLMASSGAGGFHEIDYCVSESRRGSFNTFQMAMYNLIYAKSASATNLAAKCMDLFESEYGPAPGYPKRAFGFDGTTSAAATLTDIPFVANGFADIWLREYFRELSNKNF